MDLGYTVEGFTIHLGDTVWVSRLIDIPQPIMILPAGTPENPKATIQKQLPPRQVYGPVKMIVTTTPDERVWRRHKDCWVICESLNVSRR